MPKIIKGGAFAALLFCLMMLCLAGCNQYTIYTNGPQARWGSASVFVNDIDDVVTAANGAQQTIYFWVGKWEDYRHEYVKQWDIVLGCHTQAAGECRCDPGDKMRVMFVAQGDTEHVEFTLGN